MRSRLRKTLSRYDDETLGAIRVGAEAEVNLNQRNEMRRSVRVAKRREFIGNQLLLLPSALVLMLLILIPLGQTVYYSFTDFSGYSTSMTLVGLRNYLTLFSDPSMSSALTFTLLYTAGTAILVTCLAIPLAVIFNERFVGRNFSRSMFFFPAILSAAILGLVWQFILSPLGSGMVNSVLRAFDIAPVPWLSNPDLARASVIFVAVWVQTGWHAVLYLAYLQAIPRDYYEAATIDGASGLQKFFSITLPLLVPAITISAILLVTAGLKVYDLPFTLNGGGPGYSTMTVTQSIIQSGITEGNVGRASALSVVFTLVLAFILIAQLVVSRRVERQVS